MALVAGALASAISADAKTATPRDDSSCQMSRRGASGRIAVRAGRKRFPANAEVSLSRTRANNVMGRIKNGLKKRRGVLAMYDISIRSGGKKWQPDAGDPVRVTVDLEEPVAATSSSLGVAHLTAAGPAPDVQQPRVTRIVPEDGGMALYVENLKGYMRVKTVKDLSLSDGVTPAVQTDGSAEAVRIVVPKDGDSGFYKVIRN